MLAVLNALNEQALGDVEAQFICDRSFERQARSLMEQASLPVGVHVIAAGKIRRYHGISWWRQLLDFQTVILNIRDVFLMALGTLQSLWLILRWRPDVVFTKGGFVCVPVGVAARVMGVPIVMHDSDTHPGLANRITARWATRIATGSPLRYYAYPKAKAAYVGIPIDRSFQPLGSEDMKAARTELELPDIARPLIVVTGGGLGARRLNDAFLAAGDRLCEELGVAVIHITGQNDYERAQHQAPESVHYRLLPFVAKDMARVLGAADIVVTRAGATTMLELAALRATVVIVPHPYLTGGHQLKNAAMFEEAGAAVVLQEKQLETPDMLFTAMKELVGDNDYRQRLGGRLHEFARPQAARDVATMIIEASRS